MNDFKPYLEVAEETLIRFRTDLAGMAVLRAGLLELASNPIGLDENDPNTMPRDAEEMLVAFPGATGGRRSPEARLRSNISDRRFEATQQAKESERLFLVVQQIQKELPDVVAAAFEAVDALMGGTVTDETKPGPAPAPSDPSNGPPAEVHPS